MSPVSTADLPIVIYAVCFWIWFFVWAPQRAWVTGLLHDDLPVWLRQQSFKLLRLLMLPGFIYFAWGLTDYSQTLQGVDWAELLNQTLQGTYVGLFAGAAVLGVVLWGFPLLIARTRVRKGIEPGEWSTAALTFYRWWALGILLVIGTGFTEDIAELEGLIAVPLDAATATAYALGVSLLYFLCWFLPSVWLARRVEAGEPRAVDMQPKVRWLGLLGLLMYCIQPRSKSPAVGRKGEGHKLCPSCMRPIDDIGRYESLQFENCPHCGEVIPPVFSIRDYIVHYAHMVLEAQEFKAGKRKAVKKAEKQESDMVQRMLRAILTMGVRERGTDLHLISEGGQFLVRCRTDGILWTMVELPEELLRLVVSTIKVQCNLDIAERRKPQDGSFKTMADDRKLDVRVNTSPAGDGETASMRLLYRHQVLGSLESLGMSKHAHGLLVDAIQRPHGMILVTGPTGSGKSTTLYNSLGTIADGRRNIITLEDPIEFHIEGLTQMQVNAAKNFDFATGLRSILRQDPDVIMVGEIRDGETAKMTVDAAMTGHLVFSTLHTIDTTTTIGRLLDLGVDPHRHAEALLMVIAQRLVRRICHTCEEEIEIDADYFAKLGIPNAPAKIKARRGRGCERCHESGFYEREGIYEVLRPDGTIRQLIGNRAPSYEIRRAARALGMRTLLEDGLVKVVMGRTTVEEVLRVTS